MKVFSTSAISRKCYTYVTVVVVLVIQNRRQESGGSIHQDLMNCKLHSHLATSVWTVVRAEECFCPGSCPDSVSKRWTTVVRVPVGCFSHVPGTWVLVLFRGFILARSCKFLR